MTIHTMPWTSNGTGDGDASGHGLEVSRRFFRNIFLSDPALFGVIRGAGNELALSHSTASEIDVATGAAMVYGTHINSDAVTTVTLDGVAADTAGIITIGMDWTGGITGTAQTGFIRSVQATSGSTTFPSVTQTDLTSWEIEIGRYIVDSSGNVFTDTGKGTAGVYDTRLFCGHGASGGMVKLAEFTGDGSTGTCTFSFIPSIFSSLLIVGQALSDVAAVSEALALTFNGDSGANYKWVNHEVQGGSFTHNSATSGSAIDLGEITGSSGALSNAGDAFRISIPNYAQTDLVKSARGEVQTVQTGIATDLAIWTSAGWWNNTAAITKVTLALGGNFETGTKITLYGLI